MHSSVSRYLRQNVLGLVAIFLALNAGAYAVTISEDGAAKTIFNQDLANSSVDGRVLASGAVAGPDIQAAAVGPKKMKLDKLVKYLQTRVNGACPESQLVQSIAADGSVVCAPAGAGTITGGSASSGLTGGGDQGDVALGIDPSVVQSRITDSCSGNEAVQSVGENGGVGCQAITANGAAGGDLTGSFPNPTLGAGSIDSASLFSAGLQDGAAGDATLRSLGTGADQAAAGDDPRLSDARTPTGAAGGELSGTYPNPSLDAGSVDTSNFAPLPGGKMVQEGTCQTVTNGGFPALTFNALEFGNGVTFNDGADSLTIQTAGTYLVTAYVEWDANGTGSRALGFTASGVPSGGGFDTRPGTGDTDTQGQSTMQILPLDVGTTLTANVAQTISGGGTLPLVDLGANCASLAVQWLAP